VRIDGQLGYGSYAGAGRGKAAGDERTSKCATGRGAQSPASIGALEKGYIAQATDGDDMNASAIAEAIKLLESGELDTPEAADRAARAILQFGP
jgi:hypothetical protein